MFGYEFYVDPSRCIGCQSCLKACEECETHRGVSMINFDFLDRPDGIATAACIDDAAPSALGMLVTNLGPDTTQMASAQSAIRDLSKAFPRRGLRSLHDDRL